MNPAAAVFWTSVFLLAYMYVGYPLWVALRARLFPKPVQRGPFMGRFSVLVACYNEEANIRAKLESLLAQTAIDRLDAIHVGVDGASDRTADVARGLGDPRIVVHEFPTRRGKPSVLNNLIPLVRSEVVVMTDARQRIDPPAIERLLACMHDPSVGVVSGELVFESIEGSATASGMGFYWNYEKWIRNNEGRTGSVPGATGALYAIRRSYLKPIPPNTLLDDVAFPMQAVMSGARCVFESGALAFDRPSRDPIQESIRKRRTIAGVFQLIRLFPGWLIPGKNPIWGAYISHKLLRLASPWLLISMMAANVFLLPSAPYTAFFLGQCIFFLMAAAGWMGRLSRWGAIPMMFVALNVTTLIAAWDAVCGKFDAAWRRAASG